MENAKANHAKTKPVATHTVEVLRADGSTEVVQERTLTDEEAHTLLAMVRKQSPNFGPRDVRTEINDKIDKEVDERG